MIPAQGNQTHDVWLITPTNTLPLIYPGIVPCSESFFTILRQSDIEFDAKVALRVSHSSLMSSDRMKPRSGDWAVTIRSLADMARQMLRDCIYDLQEIRQCRDCYRMSNEKEDKHWFCQPCKPQHELVYAKQKGFPYWPAKVIKIEGQMYDVRFFGGHHQRAVLDKIYIRPISVNIHTLQVKRTSSWNKACEELRRHRAQLEKLANSSEVEDSSFDDDDDLDTETEESIPKLVNESTTVRVPSNDDEDDDDEDDDDDEEEEEEEQENCAEKKQSHEITPEDEPISSSSKNIKDSREVALHVSHSSLMSSDRMKPRSGDWAKDTNSQEDVVSSSCKEQRSRTLSTQTPARWMKALSKNENSKFKLTKESELKKQNALDASMKNLEERLKAENAAQLKDIVEKHNLLISETKRKHNLLVSETKRKQWKQYTTVAGTQRTAVSSANKHTGKKNTKKFVGGNVDLVMLIHHSAGPKAYVLGLLVSMAHKWVGLCGAVCLIANK
uniref:PWWP domain-containing protein n=1 Tax=Timema poppense TaxID=170557 RepID=A0A7R9GU82_TIMPO|nr:unnamed protein product [Timema poppensis]